MAVNEFLENKWRKAFHFFDVNKDGRVTKGDLESIADYISKKTGATDDEKAKTRKEWVKWHALMTGDELVQEMSEDEWIRGCYEVTKDRENQVQLCVATYSTLFDNLDLDKDGRISKIELQIYYEAHGVFDEGFSKRVFDQLDTNKNGYIERDEMIKAGVNYWTSTDEKDGYAFIYDRHLKN